MQRATSRIALIHAVSVAITPVSDALAALWPEVHAQNLLDDALSRDREAKSSLTPDLHARIVDLGHYAHRCGAQGILYTCSAFGPAIEAARRELPIPVLKPNEAMFEAALTHGRRLGMLATFEPSVASMHEEFAELVSARGSDATLTTICVPEAMQALKAGRADEHNRLLAQAAPRLAECDALLLAHFSTSRAYDAVSAAVSIPVLTSPRSAVQTLRAVVEGRA